MNLQVLTQRIIIGKLLGLCIGVMGFVYLEYATESPLLFNLGVLAWYITFGAIIAVFSVLDYHPLLNINIAWWVRAILIGAWLNFVITLFVYDNLQHIMLQTFGEAGFLTSPFWFVLEGAIIAFGIEYIFTKYAFTTTNKA